jgi:pyruvate dehydrogenase E1 component alpha subunit
MHIADVGIGIYGANGMVAAGAPIAAGAAWAGLRDGTNIVAAAFFGEGGANQGVLHETMNLAALWRLPVLFVCENNGYAVTLPQERSTAGSLVDRAAAYGIVAESVDGMDVEAVLAAATCAVERARAGDGATFLECRTYRFFGHHTAERTMKLSYRTDDEIETWRLRDPLLVTGAKLEDEERTRIDTQVEEQLDAAVAFARNSPRPDAGEALDLVYASGLRPRDGVAP